MDFSELAWIKNHTLSMKTLMLKILEALRHQHPSMPEQHGQDVFTHSEINNLVDLVGHSEPLKHYQTDFAFKKELMLSSHLNNWCLVIQPTLAVAEVTSTKPGNIWNSQE